MPTAFQELTRALSGVADPARAGSMAAYMRGHFAFFGVPTPNRRAASKKLLRELRHAPDWEFVARCWEAPEREFQYVACDHLKQVPLRFSDLPNLKKLVMCKSWWDTVDALVKPIGAVADADAMRDWAGDDNPLGPANCHPASARAENGERPRASRRNHRR